jgi:hypothetical protein
MDAWIEFWKYACIVGFGAFYLLVLIVIPLGGRDLLRLFRRLGGRHREASDDAAP